MRDLDARIAFQHTAARRRLAGCADGDGCLIAVSTHSRPKAAGKMNANQINEMMVSTHSRPKAAGSVTMTAKKTKGGFNTQPPEGGWVFKN